MAAFEQRLPHVALERLDAPAAPVQDAAGPVTAALYQLPYGAAASRILLDRLAVIAGAGA